MENIKNQSTVCFQEKGNERSKKSRRKTLQEPSLSCLSWWLSGKESACQCRRHGFDPWSRKTAHASEKLSLYQCYWASALGSGTTTTETIVLLLLKPAHSRAHSPQQVKPTQWEAHTPQLESSPHWPQLEKSLRSNKDPAQPKNNNFFFLKNLVSAGDKVQNDPLEKLLKPR